MEKTSFRSGYVKLGVGSLRNVLTSMVCVSLTPTRLSLAVAASSSGLTGISVSDENHIHFLPGTQALPVLCCLSLTFKGSLRK